MQSVVLPGRNASVSAFCSLGCIVSKLEWHMPQQRRCQQKGAAELAPTAAASRQPGCNCTPSQRSSLNDCSNLAKKQRTNGHQAQNVLAAGQAVGSALKAAEGRGGSAGSGRHHRLACKEAALPLLCHSRCTLLHCKVHVLSVQQQRQHSANMHRQPTRPATHNSDCRPL